MTSHIGLSVNSSLKLSETVDRSCVFRDHTVLKLSTRGFQQQMANVLVESRKPDSCFHTVEWLAPDRRVLVNHNWNATACGACVPWHARMVIASLSVNHFLLHTAMSGMQAANSVTLHSSKRTGLHLIVEAHGPRIASRIKVAVVASEVQ